VLKAEAHSAAMKVFDEAALVASCKQRRERLARGALALPVEKVWRCMVQWVIHQLNRCNGATIPHLCTLTWRAEGPQRPPTAATARESSAGRPAGQRYRTLCIFHERFLQGAALKSRVSTASHVQSADLVRTEVLNCARLALNFSTDLTKDTVFAGSRELVAAIFALASEHGDVSIIIYIITPPPQVG
jgi:hypothetical protein